MNKDLIIKKQKEYIKLLKEELDEVVPIAFTHGWRSTKVYEGEKLRNELSTLESEPDEEPEYEPYFGWCDVDGCENEGCSGGVAWKETGYWTVCSKHSASERNGDVQPKMKQSAIEREESRDKVTGYLP